MGIPSLVASACIGKPATIYALLDPQGPAVFYVGVTTRDFAKRLASHRNDALHLGIKSRRCDEIRRIESGGARIEMVALERVPFEEWAEAERFWIAYLRSLGCSLTNIGTGGPGASGARQTAETQARRSVAAQGRDMQHICTDQNREIAFQKTRQPVVVDGKRFIGIKAAAAALGIPYSTFYYRLHRTEPKPRPRGEEAYHRRPVVVDGIEYWGLTGAAQEIGVNISTIQRWLRIGRARYRDAQTVTPQSAPSGRSPTASASK